MYSLKQLIIFILLTAVLFTIIGFYTAKVINKTPANNKIITANNQDTFQAGWDAAKEKLKESGFIMPGEIKALSGNVKEINGNKIILSTNLINPLDDEALKTRTVIINKDTEIVIQKEKTQEELNVEEAEKSEKIAVLKEQQKIAVTEEEKMDLEIQIMDLQMPVDFFKLQNVGIKDIKAGDNISVTAEEDIAQKQEFSASRISIDRTIMMGGGEILE